MGKVIKLSGYRSNKRKAYLTRHGAKLNAFIETFIATHIQVDFYSLALKYQENCRDACAEAWDYVDFRDVLQDAFEEVFANVIGDELLKQPWYDSRFTSTSQIIDMCLSAYIMDQRQALVP